jgi:hypothetical protein
MNPMSAYTAELRSKGYTIVRDVLTPAEVRSLRNALAEYFASRGNFAYGGKFSSRGMHAVAEVARTVSQGKILHLLQECTAPHAPLLTGECDLTFNTTSNWHKDIVDEMELGDGIFADADFTVYKIALYLQDQPASSPAVLKVRPGSHRVAEGGATLPEEPLGTRAGDVVVFDVRIDHCGQLPALSDRLLHRVSGATGGMLKRPREQWFTKARSAVGTARGSERMAVFMTFGPTQPCTFAYEVAGRKRHGPAPAGLDAVARRSLSARNVAMIGDEPTVA